MQRPEITIIGTGGLGQALARALSKVSIPIKSAFNRTSEKAEKLAEELNISISGSFPTDDSQLGEVIFITVSDSVIPKSAERLAKIAPDFLKKKVIHCSGNESAEVLKSLKLKGAKVASFHPLQTFTEDSTPADFKGIYFSLQGDESAFPTLNEIGKKLGAKTIEVSKDQKADLHAAAVVASNYLNTMIETSVEIASSNGLPKKEAKNALLPLIKTTLNNVAEHSFWDALTGPIKRGDTETVKQHLDLLKNQPDKVEIYRVLGRKTLQLADASGKMDKTSVTEIGKILK